MPHASAPRLWRFARWLALGGIMLALTASLVPGSVAHASPVSECQAVAANQVEVTQCLQAVLAAADGAMGAALQRVLQRADEIDAVTGRPVARPAVEQAQVEWQAFRERNCAVRAALTAGASGSGQFQLGCSITMARDRESELNELAAGVF